MPKPTAQNVAQQVKQAMGETAKAVAKQPGEVAGQALEQFGATTGSKVSAGQQGSVSPAVVARQKIEEMEKKDQRESAEKIKFFREQLRKIQEEEERARQEREAQLQERRQAPPEAVVAEEAPKKPEVKGKQPRGLRARLGAVKRTKTEMSAGRRSG